jgi:hypothetical protein
MEFIEYFGKESIDKSLHESKTASLNIEPSAITQCWSTISRMNISCSGSDTTNPNLMSI